MASNPEEILSSIYVDWDLVTEEEKEYVNTIDDKLMEKGSLGAHEIKALKKILRDIKNRK